MELMWGEDFEVLADVSKSVLAHHSPLEDRTQQVPLAQQVAQFAELGWLGLGDPLGVDPDSPTLATIAGIFVEVGRALAATGLLELTVARDAALAAGSESGATLAKAIEAGEQIVVGVFDAAIWNGTAGERNGVVTGQIPAVDWADEADSFLVYLTGATPRLALVPAQAVRREAMPNLGGHNWSVLHFDEVALADVQVIAEGEAATAAVRLAVQRRDVLRAAQVYGAGLRLLEMTVRYAGERRQFGGPIGRFQAVQYLCTDIAVGAHLTSAHVRAAAAELDAGRDPQLHLGLLRKQAAKTALEMVHCAHEVHAGIGYMVESNVHLFTNYAKRWQYDFGSSASNDAAVVQALSTSVWGAPA